MSGSMCLPHTVPSLHWRPRTWQCWGSSCDSESSSGTLSHTAASLQGNHGIQWIIVENNGKYMWFWIIIWNSVSYCCFSARRWRNMMDYSWKGMEDTGWQLPNSHIDAENCRAGFAGKPDWNSVPMLAFVTLMVTGSYVVRRMTYWEHITPRWLHKSIFSALLLPKPSIG